MLRDRFGDLVQNFRNYRPLLPATPLPAILPLIATLHGGRKRISLEGCLTIVGLNSESTKMTLGSVAWRRLPGCSLPNTAAIGINVETCKSHEGNIFEIPISCRFADLIPVTFLFTRQLRGWVW